MSHPTPSTTLHIVIDMQCMFADRTDWHVPELGTILPNVLRLAKARPLHTFYAKFHVPPSPRHAKGAWISYYRRWVGMTGERLDPRLLDLVAPLAALARPEQMIEKRTYSLFGAPEFTAKLQVAGARTLVFSGVETDVCVLASVFDAIDAGYHVIVVTDAVTSSSPAAHRAVIDHLLPRLPDQVELLKTAALLSRWAAEPA